jgi:hypothetical protein
VTCHTSVFPGTIRARTRAEIDHESGVARPDFKTIDFGQPNLIPQAPLTSLPLQSAGTTV